MTTSTLYHTQGTRGYNYQKTERLKDLEIYYLQSSAKRAQCPTCGSRETSLVATGTFRDIRGLNVGLKKRFCVWL